MPESPNHGETAHSADDPRVQAGPRSISTVLRLAPGNRGVVYRLVHRTASRRAAPAGSVRYAGSSGA